MRFGLFFFDLFAYLFLILLLFSVIFVLGAQIISTSTAAVNLVKEGTFWSISQGMGLFGVVIILILVLIVAGTLIVHALHWVEFGE